jgi:hypothetical protein
MVNRMKEFGILMSADGPDYNVNEKILALSFG